MIFRLSRNVALLMAIGFLVSSTDKRTYAQESMPEHQITVPMKRSVADSTSAISFSWPPIDFEDHGWISRQPIERKLTGIPQSLAVNFYGVFQMCATQALFKIVGKYEARRQVWSDYDWKRPIDSKVSFINATTPSGDEVFLFDTNNDEDFSDEKVINGIYFAMGSSVEGFRASTIVDFEYEDRRQLKTRSATVEVYKFTTYTKSRPDPSFPKFRGLVREFLLGKISLGGKEMAIAVHNRGEFATFGTKAWHRLVFDLNGDGILTTDSRSAETYRAAEPFNIGGITYEVASISPSGDELVLAVSDTMVAAKKELIIGEPAPNFAVKDITGKEIHFSDLRGKVVLLDFWATDCGPCIKHIPTLKALDTSFGHNDLVIIGISLDRSKDRLLHFVEKKRMKWIQIADGIDNRGRGPLAKLYNVHGIPHYFVVDRGGTLIESSLAVPPDKTIRMLMNE